MTTTSSSMSNEDLVAVRGYIADLKKALSAKDSQPYMVECLSHVCKEKQKLIQEALELTEDFQLLDAMLQVNDLLVETLEEASQTQVSSKDFPTHSPSTPSTTTTGTKGGGLGGERNYNPVRKVASSEQLCMTTAENNNFEGGMMMYGSREKVDNRRSSAQQDDGSYDHSRESRTSRRSSGGGGGGGGGKSESRSRRKDRRASAMPRMDGERGGGGDRDRGPRRSSDVSGGSRNLDGKTHHHHNSNEASSSSSSSSSSTRRDQAAINKQRTSSRAGPSSSSSVRHGSNRMPEDSNNAAGAYDSNNAAGAYDSYYNNPINEEGENDGGVEHKKPARRSSDEMAEMRRQRKGPRQARRRSCFSRMESASNLAMIGVGGGDGGMGGGLPAARMPVKEISTMSMATVSTVSTTSTTGTMSTLAEDDDLRSVCSMRSKSSAGKGGGGGGIYARENLKKAIAAIRNVRVKDRLYHFKTHRECFVGSEAVNMLMASHCAESREDAVMLGRYLGEKYDLFKPVGGDHKFKDEYLFYRFKVRFKESAARKALIEQGTKVNPQTSTSQLKSGKSAVKIQAIVSALKMVEVKDRKQNFKTYRACFVGSEAVDLMVSSGYVKSRDEAVQIGNHVAQTQGLFEHVSGGNEFKDEYTFYRFKESATSSLHFNGNHAFKDDYMFFRFNNATEN